jgi:hypothetical protein
MGGKSYQGRWNMNVIADYWWLLKRDFYHNIKKALFRLGTIYWI